MDTRHITKLIRESGSMLGKLLVQGCQTSRELTLDDPNLRNLSAEVSRKEPEVFTPVRPKEKMVHVLAVDCPPTYHIIISLSESYV